jgi:hypothetical protein
MFVRRPWVPASERLIAPAFGFAVATLLVLLVTGCGSHASTPGGGASPKDTSAAMTACGETKTAANVPVDIQIARGEVSCTTALAVERAYAKAILSGKVPGTGGGAPVQVQGWTCQGFTTPVVLKTGQASKCVSGSTEILAILPAPA